VLVEILLVSILPTPKQIQPSLAQNDRVKDAQRTLLPTMYNPQTIVTYSNNDGNNAQARLNDYLKVLVRQSMKSLITQYSIMFEDDI